MAFEYGVYSITTNRYLSLRDPTETFLSKCWLDSTDTLHSEVSFRFSVRSCFRLT